MHLPELALLSSNVIWCLAGTNSSQAKELRRNFQTKIYMSCFQTEIRPHDSENKRRASQETGAESSKKKVKVIDIRHSSSEVHQESKSFGKFDWNYLNLTPPSAPLGKRFPTTNPPPPPFPSPHLRRSQGCPNSLRHT